MFEPGQDLRGREELDPGGGELDCEWKPVEAAADLGDLAVGGEVGLDRAGPLEEERGGLVLERRDRVLVLAREVERLAAGGEDAKLGAGGEQLPELAGGVEDLFEVVEDEQGALSGQGCGEVPVSAERLLDGGEDEGRVAQGGEVDEPDSVG